MGTVKTPVVARASTGRPRVAQPVTNTAPASAPLPTVEMIRGEKRTAEVIK
jgi:hypothetical protein